MGTQNRKSSRWALPAILVFVVVCSAAVVLNLRSAKPSAAKPTPEARPPQLTNRETQPTPVAVVKEQPAETGEDRVVGLVSQGNELLGRGDYAGASQKYQQALTITPGEEDLHYNLAIALAKLGNTEEAKKHYAEALQIYPEYADAHNNLGNLLMNESKLDEAIPHFREAIRLMPENASFHNNLGTALVRQGKTAEAVVEFSEAVKLKPTYVEARVNLANAYLSSGRSEEAITQVNEALRLQPGFQPAIRALQRARQKQAAGGVPR